MKNYSVKYLSFFLLWLLSCRSPSQEKGLRVRLSQDPESLHPISYSNAVALQILNLTFQSLLTIDLEDKEIKPLLAEALPIIKQEDSLSYFTYKIRPEARWDNGSPITAHDVALSLKLLHSPLLDNERWRAQYGFVKDIHIDHQNPSVFTIICRGYTPEMKLLTGDFFVLPAYKLDPKNSLRSISFAIVRSKYDSLSKTSTFNALAAFINRPSMARDTAWVKGSGAYALVNWQAGQQISLVKKKNWWGNALSTSIKSFQANPNKIVFKVIPDNAAAILALKGGQLDVLENMPMVPFLELRNNPSNSTKYSFHTPASYELIFMGMNGNKAHLHDHLTRQAITHLLNVPQYIKALQGGFAVATAGIVHPQEKDVYNSALPPLTYDPQKAASFLQQAGWTQTSTGWTRNIQNQTQKLQLEIIHRAGNTDFENMALLFKQNAEAIGVKVILKSLESSQVSERIKSGNYDLFFRALAGNPFSYNLIPLLHTSNAKEGGANVTKFGNPVTDRLLEKIAIEENKATQARLLKDLQVEMRKEANLVPLYFLQNRIVLSKRIESAVISPLKPGYDLSRFKVKE